MLKKALLAMVLGLATTLVYANEVSGYLTGNIGQEKAGKANSIQHEQNHYGKELNASALSPYTDAIYKFRGFRAKVNELCLEIKKPSFTCRDSGNKNIENGAYSLNQRGFYALDKENSLITRYARYANIVNRETSICPEKPSCKHDVDYASVGLRYRF